MINTNFGPYLLPNGKTLPYAGPMKDGAVAQLIQDALEERGWNAARLAREADLSDAAVSRVLSGKSRGRSGTITRIKQVLNIDPEALDAAIAGRDYRSPQEREPTALELAERLLTELRQSASVPPRLPADEEALIEHIRQMYANDPDIPPEDLDEVVRRIAAFKRRRQAERSN